MSPLRWLTCDTCGELIKHPQDGYLEWLVRLGVEGYKCTAFKVVHHLTECHVYWRRGVDGRKCNRFDEQLYTLGDLPLAYFDSVKGQERLLSLLKYGHVDAAEWAELFFRLYVAQAPDVLAIERF